MDGVAESPMKRPVSFKASLLLGRLRETNEWTHLWP